MEKKNNQEPISNEDLEKFYLVFGGHIFFQTLFSAVEFDLFSILEKNSKMSLADIAQKLNIQEQPAKILLLGLTSVGILKKKETFYFNSPIASHFLTSSSPYNILSYIKLEHHVIYRGMYWLFDSIKNNKNEGLREIKGRADNLYERLGSDPEKRQIFQKAMSELSMNANEDLVKQVDFSKVNLLVDIGGGDGTNIIQFAKYFKDLNAIVYELPSVCALAQDRINKVGLSDRLSVSPGNCFQDPFPESADCFLFSHFFTIWSPEQNKVLLKKAYDALPSGGQTILFNMMQNDDGTGPLTAAIGSPYFLALATGKGMLYSWSEYESWMQEIGYCRIQKKILPRDHGVIIGFKD